jgi:hypothetical protein
MMPFSASANRSASEPMRFVEPAALLIKVTEQMERFDAHVGALDRPLQERPEVLAAVGMHVPVNVALGMVDNVWT